MHSLFAQEGRSDEVDGNFLFHFYPVEERNNWVAKAFEWSFHKDLSNFQRVKVHSSDVNEIADCKNKSLDCYLKKITSNLDALLVGKVFENKIEYKLYDISRKRVAHTGTFNISKGASLVSARLELFRIFKPYLEKGGLLEQKEYQLEESIENTKSSVTFNLKHYSLLILLIVLLASPLITLSAYKRKFSQSYFFPQVKKISILFLGLGILLCLGFIFTPKGFFNLNRFFLPVLGGVLWGYFFVFNFLFIFPSLQGIEQMREKVIWSYLRSWVVIIGLKVFALIFVYSTIFYSFASIGKLFGVETTTLYFIFIPVLMGIVLCFLNLILEIFSLFLDVRFESKHKKKRAWEKESKKYLIGYLKRHSISMKRSIIEKVHIVCGSNKVLMMSSYGGLLTAPRIVVPQSLIEATLGSQPHLKSENLDAVLKDSTFGTLSAIRTIKSSDKPLHINLKESFKLFSKEKVLKSVSQKVERNFDNNIEERLKLNTQDLVGMMAPTFTQEDSIPLISDDKEDMDIVEELLSEHRRELEKEFEQAEVDDTNPRARDFLFGAMLREIGSIIRNDHLLNTFDLFYFELPENFDLGKFKKYTKIPTLKKHYHRIVDSFSAFNLASDHLIQFYYYELFNKKKMLTRRASRRVLSNTSLEMLEQFSTFEKDNLEHRNSELSLRLRWLSRFTPYSLELDEEKDFVNYIKRIALASIALIALVSSYKATTYQKKYQQIIEKEQKEIDVAIKKAKKKRIKK